MKRILTTITTFLLLTSCKKDKVVDYTVEIEVRNFYTEESVAGQTIIMESCETGLMWGHSCDSIMSKVTDQRGRATFNESYKVEYGKGYEFYVKLGNGYMTSDKFDPENGSKHIITIKPLTTFSLTIDTTATFDSLKVFISTRNGYSDQIDIQPNDNLSMQIMATPDEENWLYVHGYKNGLREAMKTQNEIYPSLNGTDSLTISMP